VAQASLPSNFLPQTSSPLENSNQSATRGLVDVEQTSTVVVNDRRIATSFSKRAHDFEDPPSHADEGDEMSR